MSTNEIGNLKNNYIDIDFVGASDPKDIYHFSQKEKGKFQASVDGFAGGVNLELLDDQGKQLKKIATSSTQQGSFTIDNLDAGDYSLIVSPVSNNTNYSISLTPDGQVDPLTGLGADTGFFTVDSIGKVGFDWLHDGGKYEGELAIFSLDGMAELTPGSEAFIKEAAKRAASNSELGHIVFSDKTEGANPQFDSSFGKDKFNSGSYKGVKTFAMAPGKAFAFMLVPDGTVEEVLKKPNIGGHKQPLFSLSSLNSKGVWQFGQTADLTGNGTVFGMVEKPVNKDSDYQDIIFRLTGAEGKTVAIEEVISPEKDWTTSQSGKSFLDAVKPKSPSNPAPPVTTPKEDKTPVVTPPIEEKPKEDKTPVATPPIEEKPKEDKTPVVTPPIEEKPKEDKTPVVTPPIEEKPKEDKTPVVTPPIEDKPKEDKTPVVTPPIEDKPKEDKTPVTTPPIEDKPKEDKTPVATPPIEEKPKEDKTPVATPPIEEKPKEDRQEVEPNQPLDFGPGVPRKLPFIGIIDTGFAVNHPDLNYNKVLLGKDYIDNDNNPLQQAGEGNEHGTFVWGVIGANAANKIGIDGINDRAPVWLSRAVGSGDWDLALMEFVDEAKTRGQRNAIANLSFDLTQVNADGTVTTRYEFTPRERKALEYARQNNVLLVVAAGNDGNIMSVLGQASQEFDNIITVGAASGSQRAFYSSYGYGLDVLADGGTIDNSTVSTSGNDLGEMTGTSVAAAKATGIASLVWSKNDRLNYRQVIDILKASATDLNEPGWDRETGFGLLARKKAVKLAKKTQPEAYTPAPFLTPETWDGEGIVTPMERAAQNWEAAGDGRRKYIGWLDNTNTSDRLNFTVAQAVPNFQFSLKFPQGNAASYDSTTTLYDSNGNAIRSLKYDPTLPFEGLYGSTPLEAGSYYVLVNKGSQPVIDPYEVVLNFTGLSGEEKALDQIVYLPRPTAIDPTPTPTPEPTPAPTPTPEPIPTPAPAPAPIQLGGEIAKKYFSLGGENSWLGKAIQNQVQQPSGFIKQLFEKGDIVWNGILATAYQNAVNIPRTNWNTEFINRTFSTAGDIDFKIDRKDGQPNVFATIPSRVAVTNLGNQGANGKIKAVLNQNFGLNSLVNNVQADNFGMLASTEVSLEAGKLYKFNTKSDDGSVFYLKNLTTGQWIEPKDFLSSPEFGNGDWRDRAYTDPAKTVLFKVPQTGQYQLMFKFYDHTGGAQINAKLEETFQDPVNISKEWQLEVYKWDKGQNNEPPTDIQTATTAGDGLEYMGRVSAGSNTRPDGTKGTQQDGGWWNWGTGSPNHNDLRFNDVKDRFVVKGVTEAKFEENRTYQFTVHADDGYQLYARYQDGTKEPITPNNQWQTDAYRSKTINFTPKKSGTYKVVAYMFENTGDASFDLSWKEIMPPSSSSKSSQPFTSSEYFLRLYGDLNANWNRGIQYGTNGGLIHDGIDTTDSLLPYNVRALVGGKVISAKSGLQLKDVDQLYNRNVFNRGYHPVTGKLVKASDYNAEVVIWNEDLKRKFTYLHFSEVKVAKDSYVNPGDIIGIEGSTGYSTGRHAHLEAYTDRGMLEDPLVTLGIARGQGILDKTYR